MSSVYLSLGYIIIIIFIFEVCLSYLLPSLSVISMASPFLNPLHSHLPLTPVAGPAPNADNDDDTFKLFSLNNDNDDRLLARSAFNEKDDLATIASHLSLTSPKKKKRTSSPTYLSTFSFATIVQQETDEINASDDTSNAKTTRSFHMISIITFMPDHFPSMPVRKQV